VPVDAALAWRFGANGATDPISRTVERNAAGQIEVERTKWMATITGHSIMSTAPASPSAKPASNLPLQGVRVIDMSTVLFGPFASRWLADYGADVIKVESPAGDSSRTTGLAREPGMATGQHMVNRNKRSVVLDLKQPAGHDALLRMLESADVLMHNIRPQKIRALGLDAAALRPRFPRLIHANLVGFSKDGPYGGRPAYDDIIQGACGLADLMRRQTGEVQYLPTVAADKISGLIGAQAILMALVGRGRTGLGTEVEVPMFESMVDFSLLEHLGGQVFIPPLAPPGYARVLNRWRRPYRTLDGHVCVMPYTTEQWQRFFKEAGAPEMAADPRFANMKLRTQNIAELYARLGELIANRTSKDWLETCQRLDIPAGPVNTLEALPDDPHLRAVGTFQLVPDADSGGAVQLTRPGVRFDGEAPTLRAAHRLGQDTREVLREAGFNEAQIDALVKTGAAQQATGY